MNEKRQHARCGYLEYYEGDPETLDITLIAPIEGRGVILDISRGGLLIATNLNVSVGMPVRVSFIFRKKPIEQLGKILRTGRLQDNPADIAQQYLNFKGHEDNYIAIQFDDLLAEIEIGL